MTTDFPGLITLLSAGGVEFIVIGVSRPPSMDLPFRFDAATIARGLNFTLQTSLGDLDLLGEVAGGGTYDLLLPEAESAMLEGLEFRCVSLRRLILLKRAAGRPKDLNVLAELEALLEEREGSG